MLYCFVYSVWIWRLFNGLFGKINPEQTGTERHGGDLETKSAMRAAFDNTESVPRVPMFAVFVPRDTHIGSNTKLRLCCCPSNKIGQVFESEEKKGNVYLDDESSEPMYLKEKAYVFLSESEGVIELLQKESLRGFHIW